MLSNSGQETMHGPGRRINDFYLSSNYLPGENDAPVMGANRPVVLVVPEKGGNTPSPCTYIRLLAPLMSAGADFRIRFASIQAVQYLHADVVVINRLPCRNVCELEPALAHIRRIGAKLIYDIDDQLLDLPEDHPEKASYEGQKSIVLKLLTEADLVWTSTRPLADAFRPFCKQIQVFENYLELDSGPWAEPRSSAVRFNIVYMGTSTHRADLEMLFEALTRLDAEGEKFNLYLIGVSEVIYAQKWIKVIHPPASARVYPKFMQWVRSLQLFDLGIAPLKDNSFNRCKSPIKYWDYTFIGIPTLASDVEAYNEIIVDGRNGYLACNETEAWYQKLKHAMRHKDKLRPLADNARETLESLYAKLDGARARREALLHVIGRSVLADRHYQSGETISK